MNMASIVNLGIWAVFGVITLVCLILGVTKGLFISLLKTAKNVVAALLALPFTLIFTGKVAPIAVEKTLPLLEKAGITVGSDAPHLTVAVEDLIAAVAALLLYVSIFLVLVFVLWIVTLILGPIFKGIEKITFKKNGLSRLLGAVCGLLTAFILFTSIGLPVIGLSHTVNDATDTLLNSDREIEFVEENREMLETANDATECVVDHALIVPIWNAYERALYRRVASTKTEYGRAVLDDEIQAAVRITCDVFTLTETEIAEYSTPQVEAVMHIAEEIKDTYLLPELLAGFLSDACTAWLADKTFLGIAKPKVDPPADLMMDSVYLMFSTSDSQNIGEDLIVFAEMIGTMNDNKFFSALQNTDDLLDLLADGDMVSTLLEQLTSNEHTEVLVEGLVDMATGVLTEELGMEPEDSQAVFDLMDNVATTLNDTIETGTEEERTEAVAEQLNGFCEQFGLEIAEEDVSEVSKTLVEILGSEEIDMESTTTMYSSMISALLKSDFLDSLDLDSLPMPE